MTTRVIPTLLVAAVVSQALAWLLFGHIVYLWVQGIEALVAAVAMFVVWLRSRSPRTRAHRWPPLPPLAAIAATGGVKDLLVALDRAIPVWLIVMLLGSVAWLAMSSLVMWLRRGDCQAPPASP